MHNNYYFLRQLSRVLQPRLTGSVVSACFSQSKDELVIRFEIQAEAFTIRASLQPEFSCLSFPSNFQRARKNSVDLFQDIVGRRVTGVRQFNNERSFTIRLSGNLELLFKMHGNRTNVVLFRDGAVGDLFRNKLTADRNIDLSTLDRDIDWSYDAFLNHGVNVRKAYFTFGKVVWKYLEERNFADLTLEAQWGLIQSVRQLLEEPSYYITTLSGKPVLSLLNTGKVEKVFTDPVEAANAFYFTFTHLYVFSREKNALLNTLQGQLGGAINYCNRNSARLAEVRDDEHYKLWADLLMANLHAVKAGSDKVVLESFYEGGERVEIKLRRDLPPQKNAELFYKKAKNRHIEMERLQAGIRQKQEEISAIRQKIADVEAAPDLKSLRQLDVGRASGDGRKKEAASLPYHEFHFRDYRIWVGKHAQGNDLLTFKHSYKDDLWLHAKDVAGSHVLIKHQAGKNFPKDVVVYAASLAAYNSKRKHESLCPVIVTPRKFVRKRKGDPPGTVVVDREEVIMVEPARMS